METAVSTLIRQRHEDNKVSEGWTTERISALGSALRLTWMELAALINAKGLHPAKNGTQALLLTLLERQVQRKLDDPADQPILLPLFPFKEIGDEKKKSLIKEARSRAEKEIVRTVAAQMLRRAMRAKHALRRYQKKADTEAEVNRRKRQKELRARREAEARRVDALIEQSAASVRELLL